MASGHPDYQTWAGKAIGGKGINVISFSGEISGDSLGFVDLDAIPTGVQHSYVKLTVSCFDDTAIHEVWIQRVSDSWIFFLSKFINRGDFDLVTDPQEAGILTRIYLRNKSSETLTFEGTLSWVIREV